MLRDLSARAALPPGRRLPSIQVDFSLKFLLFVRISCTLPTVIVLWVRTVPLPHALHESPATPLMARGVDCHAAGRGRSFLGVNPFNFLNLFNLDGWFLLAESTARWVDGFALGAAANAPSAPQGLKELKRSLRTNGNCKFPSDLFLSVCKNRT